MAPKFEFGESATTQLRWNQAELDGITSHYIALGALPSEVKPNNRPFEKVHNDQYKSNPKCVSFCTSKDRIMGWMYVLTIRYYEQLGSQKEFKVDWLEKSQAETQITIQKSTDPTHEEYNKILNITVYFKTLTIMAQGNGIQDFIVGEFPLLKSTVDSIYSAPAALESSDTTSENEADMTLCNADISGDIDQTLCKTQLPDTSTCWPTNNTMHVDATVIPTSRQTCTATCDRQAVSPAKENKEGKYLEQIAGCLLQLSDVKQAISNIEEVMTTKILQVKDENTMLQLQLVEKDLARERERNLSLGAEIKAQKQELLRTKTTNHVTPPCNHGDEINRQKKENSKLTEQIRELKAANLIRESQTDRMVSEHNKQLARLEETRSTMLKELKLADSRLKDKLDTIELIENKYQKAVTHLDKATDELLAWKIHDQRERITGTVPTSCECKKNHKTLPPMQAQQDTKENDSKDILIIGTSIAKDIIPERILYGFNTKLVIKYRVEEATKFIDEYSEPAPASIILQQMSNDIKIAEKEYDECAEELVELVEKTKKKFPKTQVMVSLPPGRGNQDLHLKTLATNVAVKQKLYKSLNVHICDNSNLLVNDKATTSYFQNDLVHLNSNGTKKLASNIRETLRECLGIPRPLRTRQEASNSEDNNNGRIPGYKNHTWQQQRKQYNPRSDHYGQNSDHKPYENDYHYNHENNYHDYGRNNNYKYRYQPNRNHNQTRQDDYY